MTIVDILWIGLVSAVLVTIAVRVTVALAYHWRHAEHVIRRTQAEAEWDAFMRDQPDIGSMILAEEQELAEWEPGRGPGEITTVTEDDALTAGWIAALPRWEEPARMADTGEIRSAHFIAGIAAELRRQDDDTAEYLSRFRSRCAEFRLGLARQLAASEGT